MSDNIELQNVLESNMIFTTDERTFLDSIKIMNDIANNCDNFHDILMVNKYIFEYMFLHNDMMKKRGLGK